MSKQLKVTTRSRDKASKVAKIISVLKTYPEGATPKMIAFNSRLNVNTIKSLLPKIKGVHKVMRGLYKVVNGGDTQNILPLSYLSDWNFHNCILVYDLIDFKPFRDTYKFGLVDLEFCISKKGNASLRLACDWPLNVSSISLVSGYFMELISKYSKDVLSTNNCYVRTIEFNKDYSNLRLDGVNSISVSNLVEEFKVYQKKRGLRVEHKTKIPMVVTDVVDMLATNPRSLETDMKLNAQAQQLSRLIDSTTRNTQMLYKMIDKLKGNNQ